MSTIRTESLNLRPWVGLLTLALALVFGLGSVGSAQAQSSPEDKARFVSITRALEEAPLKPDARADRAWALKWLTDAPDVSVTACLDVLGGLDVDQPRAGEVALQYIFEMARFVIEHPEQAGDQNAQQFAGIEGAQSLSRDPSA